jgi:uncharacterized protein (DUF1800 family)
MTVSTQSDSWIAMARLVRRAGFGATGAEVDAAVALGREAYVAQLLASTSTSAADRGARATPAPRFAPIAALPNHPTQDAKKARGAQMRQQISTLTSWWVRRMIAVDSPFPEKLAFCWHSHFATSATKVRSAPLLLAQNTTLRELGRGDFRTLAQALLIDPAMLIWLDGQQNTLKGANENLAREFMELFTLGHGVAYTEADVKDGARALTGWRVTTSGHAQLVGRLHDQSTKTVLGVTGDLDQAGFGDAVLAQPGSARHVATRMYRQLVSDTDPSSATVDRLVAAYGPGRDLSALLRALLTDPSFAAAADSIVVGPVEWVVGAARALGLTVPDAPASRPFLAVLRALGQIPFYPPNVSGWPSGQAWLSTAAADIRLRAAGVMVRSADLSTVEAASAADRLDVVGHRLGIGAWSARTAAALAPSLGRPPELVALALNSPEYLVH